jgi:hypothetical protein
MTAAAASVAPALRVAAPAVKEEKPIPMETLSLSPVGPPPCVLSPQHRVSHTERQDNVFDGMVDVQNDIANPHIFDFEDVDEEEENELVRQQREKVWKLAPILDGDIMEHIFND